MYSVAWSAPLHRLIAAQEDRLAIYDVPSGELLASQVIWWGPGKHLFLSPEGHVRCSPKMQEDVVYVVLTDDGRQITLRPAEFAAKYGWKNNPEKIRLSSAPQPSAPGAAPVLDVKVSGPAKAAVGDRIRFEIAVKNLGPTVASGLEIDVSFDPVLERSSNCAWSSSDNKKTLEAGQSVHWHLQFSAVRAGKQRFTVDVTGSHGTAEGCVQVESAAPEPASASPHLPPPNPFSPLQ